MKNKFTHQAVIEKFLCASLLPQNVPDLCRGEIKKKLVYMQRDVMHRLSFR